MKLFFADGAVFDEPAAFDALERVFAQLRQGRHTPLIVDVGRFLDSEFFAEGLSRRGQAEIEMQTRLAYERMYLDRAADPVADARPTTYHAEVRTEPAPPADPCLWSLNPDDAAAWSEQPLRVLIENDADKALLLGAARAYGRDKMLAAEGRRPRWLHFDGCGGHGEVRKRVVDADRLARRFAIVDRDDRNSMVRLKDHARLADVCAARSPAVAHHIWARRSIESYLPLPYLQRRAGRDRELRATIDALAALGEALADEDMKKHLRKKWRAETLAACEPGPDGQTPLVADELDEHVGDELRRLFERIEELL